MKERTPRHPRFDRYTIASLLARHQGISPYRLVGRRRGEIDEGNEFLDDLAVRGLSERTLRTYAFCLLNFWKWITEEKIDLQELTEAQLTKYVRYQHRSAPEGNVAAKTINLRLTVAGAFYRYRMGRELPSGQRELRTIPFPYQRGPASERGYLHPCRPRIPRMRVKEPHRVVVPLTTEEVAAFLENMRSWRDLSIVALMLLVGLRSREVIDFELEDLQVSAGSLRVRGKGNKERWVPLPAEAIGPLRAYLEIERPSVDAPQLFLCLKGPSRGQPLTPAGLRSLFRYHRKTAKVPKANPHRFRHTFGTDMVRAGMSLPALMRLMGHSRIRTTMIYVEISQEDVWNEFQKALAKRGKLRFPPSR